MEKLTDIEKYEKVLSDLKSEAVELGEKIKKMVGPAEAEIMTYDAILKQIQACEKLIKLLNEWYVKRKSEFETTPQEIIQLMQIIGSTKYGNVKYRLESGKIQDVDDSLTDVAQLDEHDPNPYRSGSHRNY